jgi:L-amino acid N-acyltransferase YncA
MATRPAKCCKACDYNPLAGTLPVSEKNALALGHPGQNQTFKFLPHMLLIRPSRDEDIPAITAIYAHHVLHGTGSFETDPPSVADMTARRADVLSKGLPYLVAEQDAKIVGFAYGNWFKPRPAYRYSVEDSIYLAPGLQRKGLGRALLAELLARCEAVGIRKVMAIVGDSANAGSVGVHRSLGFTPVGTIDACGWKLGAWRDIVIMQKTLGPGSTEPPLELGAS